MDANTALNLVTLAISVTALTMTARLTRRQIQVASDANLVPVVINAFQETRSPAWFEAQEYILSRLAEEHAADLGHRGLPLPARTHANTIGLFYDDLGKLVVHGVIDQRLVIGAYGTTIVRLWDVLAPYIYAERQTHGLHFWVYFEDLATRTADMHPDVVYATMRRRPPQPEVR
ncbi:hypothetical protein [Dactylosporangium sp. NPDC000521]|uniref:DUF4760 domain-containing protein n=1 Tax=Dactylosporangium sp. NPDC000521 TaxID=3363975 RepID=UPI0036B26A1E